MEVKEFQHRLDIGEKPRICFGETPWRGLRGGEVDAILAGDRCPLCGSDSRFREGHIRPMFVFSDGASIESGLDCPHMATCAFYLQARKHVPKHDMHMTRLEPSPQARCPQEWQAKVIEVVKAHPEDSFIFYGPAGVGKTSVSTWMYLQALARYYRRESWRHEPPIWKCSLNEILTQEREWRTRDLDEECRDTRYLTADMITSDSSVFLEEVDKFGKMTDMKAEVTFAIFNAAYKHEAQLVIDTNLTMTGFEDYMEGGDNYEGTIVRRVTAMCWKVDYFNQTITPPREKKNRNEN